MFRNDPEAEDSMLCFDYTDEVDAILTAAIEDDHRLAIARTIERKLRSEKEIG
jgi:hypothetical protein